MIRQYQRTLERLATDRQLLTDLRHGAIRRAEEYHWDAQGLRMRSFYRRILGDNFDWSDRLDEECTSVNHEREVVA
jgi:hypothetical protein